MKNITKRLFAGLLGLTMIFCATPMVYATSEIVPENPTDTTTEVIDENVDVELGFNSVDEQTTLFVEVGMDKTLEIPLKLEAGKDAFYMCANINPGDTMKAKVVFKNDSDVEDAQVSVTDVINLLPDDIKAVALLDLLRLKISVDGSPLYEGPHSKITNPVTNWIPIPKGETIDIDIEIYFPKEADNTYQNANMKVKWVFEARGDIPPDPEEPEIDTGDEGSKNFSMFFLGGAAVCVAGLGLVVLTKKKREENN